MTEVFADAERAVIAGDAPALERLLLEHPQPLEQYGAHLYVPQGPGPQYKGTAEQIMAREQQLVARLVAAGATVEPAWLEQEDPRMQAALGGTS